EKPARSASSWPSRPLRLPRTDGRPLRPGVELEKLDPGVPGVPAVPKDAGVPADGDADDSAEEDGPVTPPMPPWSAESWLFLMSAAEARVPARPSVKVA